MSQIYSAEFAGSMGWGVARAGFSGKNMFAELTGRAKYLLEKEGSLLLLKHAFIYCFSYIFRYKTYGIFMHFPQIAGKLDPSGFLPRVKGHDFFIVKDNKSADDLENRGLEFRPKVFRAREALDHGGIALLVFMDGEIASITWIGMNSSVQRIFDDPPRKIDYASGYALICGAATFPKFRNKGLYTYNLFKALEYLSTSGNEKCISFTARGLPIYGISKRLFGSKLLSHGYWLRILGLQFFRERPVK
jgi:hypothetical protein